MISTARRTIAAILSLAIAFLGLTVIAPAARADEPTFTSVWDTRDTSTGSSGTHEITLPLLLDEGTYDFTVDWGDGTTEQVADPTSPVSHTYEESGEQTVSITGTIDGWAFDGGGDRLKLHRVSSWGPLTLGNSGGYFRGAANLTITALDAPDLSGTTDLSDAFLGASSLTGGLATWDVSGVRTMRAMFQGADQYNENLSAWDVSGVTRMNSMFRDADSFNADVTGWDVSSVTTMASMFRGATAFEQNLGGWNIAEVNDMSDMFQGVALDLDTYDAILEGWAETAVEPGVDFDAGDSYYNPTTSGTARTTLTGNLGWTITDLGPAGVPSAPRSVTAVAGSESAVVSWLAPSTDNHSAITGYTATATPSGRTCTTDGSELSCTIDGLANQTEYTFRVVATNAVGDSDPSGASTPVTPETREPSAPRKPFAAPQDGSTLRVYVAKGSGGGVPTSYEVTASNGGGTCTITPPATYCDFTGLSNQSYTFTARARNDDGWSGVSSTSDAATPLVPIRMKWNTSLTGDGTTGTRSLALPLVTDGTYNFVVDWGDGTGGLVTSASDPDRLHTYATDGEKIVTMAGSLRGFRFNNGGDRTKLLDVMNWSGLRLDTPLQDGEYFYGASNLTTFSATDAPDMSTTNSLEQAFSRAGKFNGSISHWDVSHVTDLSSTFSDAYEFNQSLNGWDTSNVTKMFGTFNFAFKFNGAIDQWNTASVTDMRWMFRYAQVFNQPLPRVGAKWNTSNVTDFDSMFEGAPKFNQSLATWNTGSATDMNRMFNGATEFNGELTNFDTSDVTDLTYMFQNAAAFNQPLAHFDTSKVTNLTQTFNGARAFNQPIGGWDVSKVTSLSNTFANATVFNQDLSGWDTGAVTSLAQTFRSAAAYNQPMDTDGTNWDVSKVLSMSGTFHGATAFNRPLSNWNTAKVTNMASMFQSATNFNQALATSGNRWNTSEVTDMSSMFNAASAFNQDVRTWDIGGVTDMTTMFTGSALSTRHYDKLLVSWAFGYATDGVANGQGTGVTADSVVFGATPAKYSTGQPTAARTFLVNERGWTITDGGSTGLAPDPEPAQTQAPATPAPPVALPRPSGAKVGWITPPTSGGDPVTYTVTASPGGTTCTITLPERTCLVSGLTNGADYTFTATATNVVGTSAPSSPSATITPGEAFQTTWRTNNSGSSNSRQVTLPLVTGGTYNFVVRWGDGSSDTITSAGAPAATHTYAARGDYDVAITGTINGWNFSGAKGGDRRKLLDVSRWGPLRLGNDGAYFQNATNATVTATDALDLTGTTNLSSMFSGVPKFNAAIGNWDVSAVTNMTSMFSGASTFNQPLNSWDTSSVTNMSNTFFAASRFNQPLSNWRTGNVTTMSRMFFAASSFNQPIDRDGAKWNTGNVTTMQQMFYAASAFNQNLANWDTAKVTNMAEMFRSATQFNGAIGSWDTGKVTTLYYMFGNATAFNQDLNDWDTGRVTTMAGTFYEADNFNQPIGHWNTSAVTDMNWMFNRADRFNQSIDSEADYSRWVTSNVTNMNRMFENAIAFNQDLNSWNTSKVTGSGFEAMFAGAAAFNGKIGNWDVSGATTLRSMLNGARPFNQNVSGWNTARVTDFGYLFNRTSFRGDLSTWNVTSATNMEYMLWDITPPESLRGLRSTPWYNRILVAWSQQNVKLNVQFMARDTGYSSATSYPKYSTHYPDQPDSAAELAIAKLTGYGAGQKRWYISDQGSTPVDAPGMPQNVEFSRTGANGGPLYGNGDRATITWERPITGDLIAEITYVVESTRDPNFRCVTTALSCVITGLPVNDRATSFHQFRVTATNAIGDSDPTIAIPAVRTPAIPAPALGTPVQTEYGFRVQITNHTDLYDWEGSATLGSVAISNTGLVTVGSEADPVPPDTRSTLTVVAGKFGYADQSTSVTARALKQKLVPAIGPVTRIVHGWTAEITNYDADYDWGVTVGPAGSATIEADAGRKIVTVVGLDDGQSTTATVTSSRTGYADGVVQTTDAALGAALHPTFTEVTPTSDGFTAQIPNYDPAFTWAPPTTDEGVAAIQLIEGVATLRVTEVDADTLATATLTTSRTGYRGGSGEVSQRSLKAPLSFTLGTSVATPDGFTVPITGFDAAFEWTTSSDAGEVDVSDGVVTVTGLSPDTTTDLIVTAERDGYTPSSQSTSGTSLKEALTPEIVEPVSTPDGFTAVITNYNGTDYAWQRTTTAGVVAIEPFTEGEESGYRVVVTELAPADPATVRLRTTRDGFAPGVLEFTASSLRAKLDPDLGPTTRTDGGFTTLIRNYDDVGYDPEDYQWEATSVPGSASIDAQTGLVTVTGLEDGQTATVTVTSQRVGYAKGTSVKTAAALEAPRLPVLGAVVRTVGGFDVPISNWDGQWEWVPSLPEGVAGSVELVTEGEGPEAVHLVRVTGLADGATTTVTVLSTREDYLDGDATKEGQALTQARTPELGEPTAVAGGFEVEIRNYDSEWEWDATPTAGEASIVTRGEAPDVTHVVVVSGLGTDASADLTVTNTRDGYRNGEATINGTVLRTARTPVLGEVQRRDKAIRIPITNFDDQWEWTPAATQGDAALITVDDVHLVQVTGLTDGQVTTVTVTSSRTGWFDGTNTPLDAAALEAARRPVLGDVVRTVGGFDVPISNWDGQWEWVPSLPEGVAGSVELVTEGEGPEAVHLVRVTGLADGATTTVTVLSTREDYLDGDASKEGQALTQARTPELGEPTAVAGGFEVEIRNYDSEWEWDATPTAGEASIVTRGEAPDVTHVVVVSGLGPDASADLTVTNTRDGYRNGEATINGTVLRTARTPVLGEVQRRDKAIRIPITNFDDQWEWTPAATQGDAALITVDDVHLVQVTGLTDGQLTTVTVTSSRTGWFDGTNTPLDAAALEAPRLPVLGDVVRTVGGVDVPISNWDGQWEWVPSLPEGVAGSVELVTEGEGPEAVHLVRVTGLADGATTTVTVLSSREDYLDGDASKEGQALTQARTPELGEPTAVAGGFEVEIRNYDSEWEWDATPTAGEASIVTRGEAPDVTHVVVVSGLGPDASADLTVTNTRDGYRNGEATINGTVLRTARTPVLGEVQRRDKAIRIPITNFDDQWEWTPAATQGDAALITVDDVHLVQVTGLTDGQLTTVTVTSSRTGWFDGTNTPLDAAALEASLNPDLAEAVPGDGSFTVAISNYDGVDYDPDDYQWEVSATPGSASLAEDTGIVTVSGLTNGQEAQLTVSTTRDGSLPGQSATTGFALRTARTPDLGTVQRRDGAIRVPITNFDADWEWTAEATEGDAALITVEGVHLVEVTNLTDGEETTVTVTSTRDGWFDGTNTTTGEALDTELVPVLVDLTPADRSFTARIDNYDGAEYDPGDYTWDVSATAGSANLNADTGVVTVSGLTNGQEARLTVTTTRTGYLAGNAGIDGRALRTALTPDMGSVTRLPGGFTAPIRNYDPAFEWGATATVGTADIVEVVDGEDTLHLLQVTGLGVSERSVATVTTTQAGWFPGSTPVSGRSELAQLDPILGEVVRAEGQFTALITNYDEDYEWSATATAGEASIVADGDDHLVKVTGLADGGASTVTVTATTGEVAGTGTTTGAALDPALDPVLAEAVPGDGSFTVAISNYDGVDYDPDDYQWEVSATPGSASLAEDTGIVTVSGLTNGQEAQLTVSTTRDGSLPGQSATTGFALRTARTPDLGTVQRRDGAIRVPITNFDADWEWTAEATEGDAALITVEGVHLVEVTNLTDGEETTVTVTSTRDGWFDGTNTTTGEALDTELVPVLVDLTPADRSFTARIDNYDGAEYDPDDYTWDVSATAGSANLNADTGVVTVSGLTNGQEARLTVATTRTGYLAGSAGIDGRALRTALTPDIPSVTRTADGFTGVITNYDADFEWGATATVGTADIVEVVDGEDTLHVLRITGLEPSQRSVATVTTTQAGWFPGQTEVRGRAVLGALAPAFTEVVRLDGGVRADITNWDEDYDWSATTTAGEVVIHEVTRDSETRHEVLVSELADGQEATVTVTADTGTIETQNSFTESALDPALDPVLAEAVPGDGSFTVAISNYDGVDYDPDDYQWEVSATPGSASLAEDTGIVTVSGLTNGQEAQLTVSTTRDGSLPGQSATTGFALRTARTPDLGTVQRRDGAIRVPITNFDADWEWTVEATDGDAALITVEGVHLVEVTNLTDGEETTITVTSTRDGWFDGTNTKTGTALNTELTPQLGTATPARESFLVPIENYDGDFTWSATATAGTAAVVELDSVWYARVTGLAPLQEATVTVRTVRNGYLDGSASRAGAAQIGGRLDPSIGTPTPTADGFTAVITNHTADFNWGATATVGTAQVVRRTNRWFLVVTGVDPDTSVTATVTTTRPNYDTGSASVDSRSLKQAFVPQLGTVERMSGGFSVEVLRYSSRYRWTARTTAGRVSITDQGIVRVTALSAGRSATVTVRTTRSGYADGVTTVIGQALGAARTPVFGPRTATTSSVTAQIRNYNPTFQWRISANGGTAVISSTGRITVRGLAPGQGTTVTVVSQRSGYDSGTASFSANAAARQVNIPSAKAPGRPRITAIRPGKARATASVQWAATATGGAPILRARAVCLLGKTTKAATSTTSPVPLKGLKKGARYTCRVTVTNQVGTSLPSLPVKFTAK